jgi:hypothetical protein
MRKLIFNLSILYIAIILPILILSGIDIFIYCSLLTISLGCILWLTLSERLQMSLGHHKDNKLSPGIFGRLLDKYNPYLHLILNKLFGKNKSSESRDTILSYLSGLKSKIREQNVTDTYVALKSKLLPQASAESQKFANLSSNSDSKLRLIRQRIKELTKLSKGGDGATARIAALNKNSKEISNIIDFLQNSNEPVIILGEPGSGKTKTLLKLGEQIVENETKKLFPSIVIYKRLGDFLIDFDRAISNDDILNFIQNDLSEELKKQFIALCNAGRVIVLFDGMDEMSRQRYSEYNKAFSDFAKTYEGKIKSLFTCRINDFSPKFTHKTLVILPFGKRQIQNYIASVFDKQDIVIGNHSFTPKKLAEKIINEIPLQSSNPFTLFLICYYLSYNEKFPDSKSEVLEFFVKNSFRDNNFSGSNQTINENQIEESFLLLTKIAFIVSERNEGKLFKYDSLLKEIGRIDENIIIIENAIKNRVLSKETESSEVFLRFEHHRIQEFLTAMYLKSFPEIVDWDNKLDSLRWQDILFYLTESYPENPAIESLINSLKDKEDEFNFAYRVELASRILKILEYKKSETYHELYSATVNAIDYLFRKGNPSSKLQMVWAAMNIPDYDVMQHVKEMLSSPITWLRSQALKVYTSELSVKRNIGINFTEEILTDYANGLLFKHFPIYVKSIWKNKSISALLFYTIAIILNLVFLISVILTPITSIILIVQYLDMPPLVSLDGLINSSWLVLEVYTLFVFYRIVNDIVKDGAASWFQSIIYYFFNIIISTLAFIYSAYYFKIDLHISLLQLLPGLFLLTVIIILFYFLLSYLLFSILCIIGFLSNFKNLKNYEYTLRLYEVKYNNYEFNRFTNLFYFFLIIGFLIIIANIILLIHKTGITTLTYLWVVKNFYSIFVIMGLGLICAYIIQIVKNSVMKTILWIITIVLWIVFMLSVWGWKFREFDFDSEPKFNPNSFDGYIAIAFGVVLLIVLVILIVGPIFIKLKNNYKNSRISNQRNLQTITSKETLIEALEKSEIQLQILNNLSPEKLNITSDKEFFQLLKEIENLIDKNDHKAQSVYWSLYDKYKNIVTMDEE